LALKSERYTAHSLITVAITPRWDLPQNIPNMDQKQEFEWQRVDQ
jgi:hypothetical protein